MKELAKQSLEKLWEGFKANECENCTNNACEGRLNYDDLCSNINYLRKYGKQNYEKNRETFYELKKLIGNEKPAIFSFGCGLGLDFLGAVEVFGDNGIYYPIDENRWAIVNTDNYRNFKPKLPKKTMSLEEGIMLLSVTSQNAVICFFNSLFAISKNTQNLNRKLITALQSKKNFFFVCNYTMNSNLFMPSTELEFIDKLLNELKYKYSFKKLEILSGKGIIISGERK